MNGNDILGPFNSDDLKRQIKQEYGVDLNTFIKIGWQEE
jgi:hypothetical protein